MFNPPLAAATAVLLFAATGSQPKPPDWSSAVEMLQQQQQQQSATVHVPRVTVTSTTIILRSPAPVPVKEKKANDCVKIDRISGFSVNRDDSVDLLMNDGKVLRAKLGNNCRALGFYSGFYVKANADRKLCAGRDAFRLRSGRSCEVEAFRSLAPAR